MVGRGAAYADYDQDGDLDVLLTANQGKAVLLRNDTERSGHVVRVVTRGSPNKSNRNGIGARVKLYTDRQNLKMMVRTGGSYLSQNELTLTFGIQADEQIDRLEVRWPAGGLDVFRDLPLDTVFIAQEGAAASERTVAQRSKVSSDGDHLVILKRQRGYHRDANPAQSRT